VTLSGTASRTVITGANGAYRFDNLLDGTYTVTQTQPTGFNDGPETQGVPLSGNVENDRFVDILLSDNVALTGYNFGEQAIIVAPSNSIAGYVYVDANDNGIFDSGELPINGATVSITGPVNLSLITRTDGSYSFTSLPNGTYAITQNQVAGYTDGKDTQGTPILGAVENDRFVEILLTGNIKAINYNFGEREVISPSNNSVSGLVYVDTNGNGRYDAGEQPIRGVVIDLVGAVSQTLVTGTDGSYRFFGLPNGIYSIIQTQPSGFDDGAETQGNPLLGTVSNDRFQGISLNGGINAVGYNFGEKAIVAANSSLAGSVYIDRNRNGQRDANEPGLRQVEIRLSGTVDRTVLTNEAGNYFFDGLPAGTYNIFEVQPAPYDDGEETLGTLGGTLVSDGFNSIVLDGIVTGTGYSFGEILRTLPSLNSIGGIVYLDVNNNGRRDPQELVVPNVQITLSGTFNSTTFTGADGTYAFANLPDGVYTVAQTHPADFLDGIDSIGTPASGVLRNDRFENVILSDSMVAIGYNFGERGLRFPNKIHLLASTPPSDQIIMEKMQGVSLRTAVYTGPESLGHNPHFSMDTDYDGYVTPLDVLVLINAINSGTSGYGYGRVSAGNTVLENRFLDVDNDRLLSPLDVLLVTNFLNQRSISLRNRSGEGESGTHGLVWGSVNGVAVVLDVDLRSRTMSIDSAGDHAIEEVFGSHELNTVLMQEIPESPMLDFKGDYELEARRNEAELDEDLEAIARELLRHEFDQL